MIDETRTRFLATIAKQVSAERVIEAHLFPGIKQGGVESGIAVLALERVVPSAPVVEALPEPKTEATEPATDGAAADASEPGIVAGEESDTVDVAAPAEDVEPAVITGPASRYTVYTARYRHTLKGLDRGKWEVSVTEEADAPLLTIEAVVRGVHRRSGDIDDAIRLSGDEFRAALPIAAA